MKSIIKKNHKQDTSYTSSKIGNFSLKFFVHLLIYLSVHLSMSVPLLFQAICCAILFLAGKVDLAAICSEPANLAEQYAQYMAKETESSVKEYLDSYPTNNTLPDEEEQLIYGDKTCPASLQSITTDPNSKVFERTTCPFFLVASHLSTRYPKIINEARCKCQACLEEKGHSTITGCEPVYRPVRVLLRTGSCVNGVYQYSSAMYMKQEGCTCAKKREALSVPVSNTSSNDDPITM